MIDNRRLTDKVIKELTEMITVKQVYRPGDKLPNELELAKELGVSRTTLRDAMTYLVSTNVLKRIRGKGTFVLDNDELSEDYGFNELNFMHVRLKDLYEVRLILEPEMTAIATRNATDEEIKEIVRLQNIIADSVSLQGEEAAAQNRKYHNAIAMASHNEFVIRLYQNISTATVKAFGQEKVVQENAHILIEGHEMITEMMRLRDAEGAKLAMRLHLKQSIEYYHLNI